MSYRDTTRWMWNQARDLMDQAEHLHRQFFQLSAGKGTQAVWEPPVDVFEDEREVVIVIALPGVCTEGVEIRNEAGTLVVRAERRIPFAGTRRAVRRLEIPYGRFERRVALPSGRYDAGAHEFVDGCLILKLRKAGAL